MKSDSRLVIILLVCVFSIRPLLAQTSYDYSFAKIPGTKGFLQLSDNEGSNIKSAGEPGVNGTPMLSNIWLIGTIHFQSGETVKDSAINYSLYSKKLYKKQDNYFFEIVQPIVSISFVDPDEKTNGGMRLFKTGYPNIEANTNKSLYEVLFEGENLELLLWQQKRVIEINNYGKPNEKEYELLEKQYIYFPQKKKIEQISISSISNLKKSLPIYADAIQNYTSSHKVNLKNKEQLTGLLNYLDKVN